MAFDVVEVVVEREVFFFPLLRRVSGGLSNLSEGGCLLIGKSIRLENVVFWVWKEGASSR